MKKKLLSGLLLALLSIRSSEAADVCGYVFDARTHEPIENVSVACFLQGTYTDYNGRFCFSVKDSTFRIDATYIGYEKASLYFTEQTRDTTVFIYLRKAVKELNEVTVTANAKARQKIMAPQMGALSLDKSAIANTPTMFGEHDIIKAIQAQPGVSAGTEGFSGLYVRGGNNDENLFLMDGVPLYQETHLGGLFSAFNNEVVKDAEFFKSSFPAKYGGRLSSIINVHTQEGDTAQYGGSAMIGLISGKLNVGGPVVRGKSSFNASVRRSWFELLSVPALAIKNRKNGADGEKTIARYAFMDFNFRFDQHFSRRSRASVCFYYGDDYLKYGNESSSGTGSQEFRKEDIDRLKWGNVMASANWDYAASDFVKMRATAYYTRYKSDFKRSVAETSGAEGEDGYSQEYERRTTKSGIDDFGGKLDFDCATSARNTINFGLDYVRHNYRPGFDEISSNAAITDTTSSASRIRANELGLYIEDRWDVSRAVCLQLGMRAGYYRVHGEDFITPEPRASARFLLSRNMSLKASYSRMAQYAQQVSDSYIDLPTDFWLPIATGGKPLVSDQVSAGVFYNLKDEYSLSVEGYYKWMKNLIEYKDGYGLLSAGASWYDKLASGDGRSYGAELTVSKETGKLTGSASYGLMWADRQFDEINRSLRFRSKYDNRHKINLYANYKFSDNVELNANWTYTTGNRMTLALESYYEIGGLGFPSEIAPGMMWGDLSYVEYYESKNNVRLPAYHRLDLGLNIYFLQGNGYTGTLTVGLYNAYCRMNPMVVKKVAMTAYQNDESGKWNTYFETFSLFPIIPSISYTYKF